MDRRAESMHESRTKTVQHKDTKEIDGKISKQYFTDAASVVKHNGTNLRSLKN